MEQRSAGGSIRVALGIYSSLRSAAAVSARLGARPTRALDMGKRPAPGVRRSPHTFWTVEHCGPAAQAHSLVDGLLAFLIERRSALEGLAEEGRLQYGLVSAKRAAQHRLWQVMGCTAHTYPPCAEAARDSYAPSRAA